MSELYDILELCLQEIEKGTDIDSVLSRYPTHARELRPILETAVKAIKIEAPDASSEIVRRNRAKVLRHAAQMREAKAQTRARRIWSVPLRRALVALIVIGVLFMSSTGLVRAASTTLPGDQLYPVKRTWEDVLVTFTFNTQSRDALEVEHENERLYELNELFAKGRSVQVDFSGLVTRQNPDLWLVAGIPVVVSAQTELPTTPIITGNAVHITGTTQKDGAVLAQRIELLPSGVPLPKVNDDNSSEVEQDNSGKGSEGETPTINATQTPKSESESETESSKSEPQDQSLSGTVQSINGNIVVVNGQIMNVSSAEIKGTPQVGASAKVEGYYDANGVFIVTKIEFGSGSGGESTSGSNDGGSLSGSNDSGGSNTSGGSDDHSGGSGGDGSSGGGSDSGSSGSGGD